MLRKKLKEIFSGGFWILLASIFQRFSSIIVLPVIARLLGPESLGTFALIQQTIQTGDNFSRLGIDAAVHRNGSQIETIGKDRVGRLFGVAFCLSASAAIFLCLCLWLGKNPIAKHFLGDAQIAPWLPLSGVILVLTLIADIPRWYFAALQAFRFHSVRDIATTIVGSVITIILVYTSGLSGAIYGLLITAIIRLLWGGWLTHILFKEKQIKLRIDKFWSETISILRFGLPFYLSNFLGNFITLPILGWLTSLGGVQQVGYIRVAQSFAQLISFIPSTIAPVMVSSLSASFASDNQEYNKLKSIHLRTISSFTIIVSVAICFSLEFVIPTLFGESYMEAILLSKITIWNTAIGTVASIFTQYLISSGQTSQIAFWNTLSLIINLLFCFLLIPQYKTTGFLLSQSFSVIFSLIGFAKSGLYGIEKKEREKISQLFALGLFSLTASFLSSILLNKYLMTLISLEIAFMLSLLWLIFKTGFKPEEISLLNITVKKQLQRLNKLNKN